MAKKVEKSPAALLAEQIENGVATRVVPTFIFPATTVRAELKKNKLKIVQAARALDLEPATVSDAAKGRNIRLAAAVKLAEFFAVPVEQLFGAPRVRTAEDDAKDKEEAASKSKETDSMFEAKEPGDENP